MKKRVLSAILATAMAVSFTTTAFAATAVPGYIGGYLASVIKKQTNGEFGTYSVSTLTAQKTEAVSFVESEPRSTGDGDVTFVDVVKQREITYNVIPAGAVISVAVQDGFKFDGSTHTSINTFAKNTSGAFVEQDNIYIPNAGTTYTVPAAMEGKMIAALTTIISNRGENPESIYAYFYVNSSATPSSTAPAAVTNPAAPAATPAAATAATYKSDTGKSLNIKANKVYEFKITSLNGKQPTFNVTGSAFKVSFKAKRGNDYHYLVKAVGKVGQYGSIYVNGEKTACTTISIVK
ncbi:hypothetical protein [Clostridium merdae]|uniref:hypothetical protein n=1 Tax=Clostridium merdae TaxID=1958780 RepID=UPI000A26AEAD|nr:hypothetical protein [Clostridium merdae]